MPDRVLAWGRFPCAASGAGLQFEGALGTQHPWPRFSLTFQTPPAIIWQRLIWQRPGEVAQLGERRVRNAKVVGSSPIFSTNETLG